MKRLYTNEEGAAAAALFTYSQNFCAYVLIGVNWQISLVTILTFEKITSSTAMLNRHFLIYSNFPYTLGKAACYHKTVI